MGTGRKTISIALDDTNHSQPAPGISCYVLSLSILIKYLSLTHSCLLLPHNHTGVRLDEVWEGALDREPGALTSLPG